MSFRNAIFLLLGWTFSSLAVASPGSPKATLMVLLDLSTSMDVHRTKLASLAPILRDTLKENSCQFEVIIGNIAYKGHDANLFYLKALGDPAVINESTPGGPDIVYNRIMDPVGTAANPAKVMKRGGLERTYSSIAMSIKANQKLLKESDVVGTLLLTDAAPGFEKYLPDEAYQEISKTLGYGTLFYSGIIAPTLNNEMTIPTSHLTCPIDFSTRQSVGSPIDPYGFFTPDMNAINEFSQIVGGLQWDVCEPNYDLRLRTFINTILSIAECKPIS